MLAMLFGCGFRRSALVSLELDAVQMRQGHWAVVDLIGKGGHIRAVPAEYLAHLATPLLNKQTSGIFCSLLD
jgi:site-specific recombinase XerC